MNAFERLGLPKKLALDPEELEKAGREASQAAHPDQGGHAEAFEKVRAAIETLKIPHLRVKEALAMVDRAEEARGEIPGAVMTLFSPVAASLEDVEKFIRERAKARSGLGRAVLDATVPTLKVELEKQVAAVSALEDELVGSFPEFDAQGWVEASVEMAETYRALVFVAKWKAQLREAGGKLFEALLGG